MNWFGNLATKISGFDPSRFHKYGMLINQTDTNTVHIAGYVDDVLINEGTTTIGNSPNIKMQRNYLVVDLTGACNWDEGGVDYCTNQPFRTSSLTPTGIRMFRRPTPTMTTSFAIGITGVTGVTSPINGNFGFKQDNWARRGEW